MTSLAPDINQRSASTSSKRANSIFKIPTKDLKKVVHQLEQETQKHVSTKTIKQLIKKNR